MAAVRHHSLGVQQRRSLRRHSVAVDGLRLSLEKQVASDRKWHGVEIKQHERSRNISWEVSQVTQPHVFLNVRHKCLDKRVLGGEKNLKRSKKTDRFRT